MWSRLTGGEGHLAVRGGFGLFHNRIFQSVFSQGGISLRSLPPWGVYKAFDATFNVADPTGGFAYDPSYDPGRITIVRVAPDLGMPNIQQYNFTLERQLPGQITFSAGYNRTRGIGLLQNQVTNRARFPFLSPVDGVLYDKIDPDLGNTRPASGYISLAQPRTNQRRPDPRYGAIYSIANGSWSYFNSLRLEVKKRLSHELHWQVYYTFGKTIDTGSDVTAGVTLTENASARSLRGLSDFDQRHRLNLNYSYTLPWFKKSRGLTQIALGGWTLTGNLTFASGKPFAVTAGYDLNADGVTNDRPVLLDQSLYHRSVDNGRIDPQSGVQISKLQLPIAGFYPTFQTPQAQRPFDPGGSGKDSIGRNIFFGEGIKNLDLGIYKAFAVREGRRLLFRAEMYSAANTPRFSFPSASVLSQNFGAISSTYNPFNFVGASRNDTANRIIQLALRYTF